MRSKKWFWQGMMQVESRRADSYRNFIRSYAACASFADAQIGRVLDALDNCPRGKDTVVVLWSDHGFHLGEKNHIEKFALWEKSNHVPLIVLAPGTTKPNSVCEQPVDLTSHFRGEKRVAPLFLALPYDIPRGSAAAYFPETNVLVPIDSTAEISQTPTSKAIEITISPAQPAG